MSNLPPHSNGKPMPSPDMLARAADILGVDDTTEPARSTAARPELMVTVAGPTAHKVLRLPADVPVGQLAARLGEAVGVKVIRVSNRDREPITPDRTLQDLGLRAGSVLLVDAPGAKGVLPETAVGLPPAPGLIKTSSARRRPQPGTLTERTPAQWGVLAAGLIVLIVLAMLLGGAVFGGGSSTSAPAGQALADRAAAAWVNGTAFGGGRLSSVPADLGRSGPPAHGLIAQAGASTSGGITSHLYIVTPPAGDPYGLSVVTYKNRIAYPLTVAPIPFATSVPAGRAPSVIQTGTIVAPTATKQAQAWAAKTFGTVDKPADPMGYGLDGTVSPVNEWRPAKGGPALVVRVQVPLAGVGPDSAQAKALSADQAAVDQDEAAVATDKSNAAKANAALGQAQTANQQADQAAQSAVNAANTANPPNPPPLAAAATAAQQAASGAQARLSAAQQAQSSAGSAVGTDQQKLAQDQATLRSATAGAARVTSVYDVAFNAAGTAIGWAPADYLIGTNGQEVG